MSKPKNIIWSVDAYGESDLENRTLGILRTILGESTKSDQTVTLVYALSPDQVNVSPQLYPKWRDVWKASAQSQLEKLARSSSLANAPKVKVLDTENTSTRSTVNELLRYADESKAELIVVSTHARKGLKHFLLGSFCETLLLHSRIPVLVSNPESKTPEAFRRILYPTDFSQQSRRGFERAVHLAKDFGAELVLYYKLLSKTPVIFAAAPVAYEAVWEDSRARLSLSEAWLAWARDRGIKARVLHDELPSNVVDGIVKCAEAEKCDLIAMVTQATHAEAVLLGSTARGVVRQSKVPVWVEHAP